MTKEKKISPMTKEKKIEVVQEILPPISWVFKGNLKHNGKLFKGGSVCPKECLEEMKALGFVEEK